MGVSEQPGDKSRKHKDNKQKKIPWNKWKWECNIPKFMGCSKSSSKRNVCSNKSLSQETRKVSNEQPNYTSRSQKKKKKNCQVSIGVPHFVALYFVALCRYCIFYKLKVCGHPALSDDG